jgi:hypothetical protein
MSDDFQEPYEYQQPYEPAPQAYQPEPKKKMSGWVIALIVVLVIIVVCCLCICLSTVVLGPAMGTVFSDIVETLEVPTY